MPDPHEWIRVRLKQLGMTQRALAEAFNCAEPMVGNLIRGNRKRVTVDELEKIQEVLRFDEIGLDAYALYKRARGGDAQGAIDEVNRFGAPGAEPKAKKTPFYNRLLLELVSRAVFDVVIKSESFDVAPEALVAIYEMLLDEDLTELDELELSRLVRFALRQYNQR